MNTDATADTKKHANTRKLQVSTLCTENGNNNKNKYIYARVVGNIVGLRVLSKSRHHSSSLTDLAQRNKSHR